MFSGSLFHREGAAILVLPYGLPDITLNKSLDVMLSLDNKSPMERITSISTNTQLSLLNYRQRFCVIYLCNNEVLSIFLEYQPGACPGIRKRGGPKPFFWGGAQLRE